MTAPFSSLSEYERFIYSLQDSRPEVVSSTLRLFSTSALTGMLEGEITLRNGLMIRVLEVIDFKSQGISFLAPNLPAVIEDVLALN